FVFTSNVDGQFQKAGFNEDKIHECHGSIHHLQCTQPCCDQIWSAKDLHIEVNEETLTATTPLPKCPYCGSVARPNILLFGDMRWVSGRAAVQHDEQDDWVAELTDSPLIIECGAGTHVPSVRYFSQQMIRRTRATLIRINPREAEVPANHVSIALPALEAIEQINEARSRAGAS
ncbi:MAG: Sir2 family NAD-dependent protein deacetylase, partial [Myxococcota bacterium]|nr:Sir2 family NAD-dependent protein deacetylase [Myxococcota bacterium]